jgi:hypothetical protein
MTAIGCSGFGAVYWEIALKAYISVEYAGYSKKCNVRKTA